MLKIPEFTFSLPAHRYLGVFAAFVLPLLLGVGGVYWNYVHELGVLSHKATKLGVSRIERVLKYAHVANYKAASLIGAPCEEIWLALRKEAAEAAFVRTINLAQNDVVYCSSLFGNIRIEEPSSDFYIGKIRLLPGNLSHPDRPVLSVRDTMRRGSVISNIDGSYLTLMMSMGLNGGQAFLRVGENWLDQYGRFYAEPPALPTLAAAERMSVLYPLKVYVGYPSMVGQWQYWLFKKWIPLGMVLTGALSCALLAWCWLGRPRSPHSELARGLDSEEFIPYVQQIVDAHTRQVCGVEVLMRWRHPITGLIEPSLFIPQAESSGLIVPMTSQMIRRVAQALAPLQSDLPKGFNVAFNISAAHFSSMALVYDCRLFLSRFAPGCVVLTLELTERELLHNDSQTQQLFNKLRAMGVQFALDDFGTGHASLAYLKQFRLDILKIDQSFVRRIGLESLSQHIVDSVIDLGMKLGMVVVAEGVETSYQADYLRDKGVDHLQGYLFSRPLPIADFVETFCHPEQNVVSAESAAS